MYATFIRAPAASTSNTNSDGSPVEHEHTSMGSRVASADDPHQTVGAPAHGAVPGALKSPRHSRPQVLASGGGGFIASGTSGLPSGWSGVPSVGGSSESGWELSASVDNFAGAKTRSHPDR